MTRALAAVCLGFAGLGLLLALASDTALFAPWVQSVATSLGMEAGLPPSARPFLRVSSAILGGSIAGKWVAAWFLVRHGLPTQRSGALLALAIGHAVWFVLDTASSLLRGAWPNVLLINLVPGLLFAALLWAARERTPTQPASLPAVIAPRWVTITSSWSLCSPARKALLLVCVGSAGVGVLCLFGPPDLPFGPYLDALRAWAGPDAALQPWQGFVFGLVGATFCAHFVLLVSSLLLAPTATWPLRAVATSIAAWFVTDSSICLREGAVFNVLLINVPSLLLVLVPLGFAWRLEARGGQRPT